MDRPGPDRPNLGRFVSPVFPCLFLAIVLLLLMLLMLLDS